MEQKEKLIKRLKELECRSKEIEQLQKFDFDKDQTQLLMFLKKWQEKQQEVLDRACEQIDCIDYFIYELEKKDKQMRSK